MHRSHKFYVISALCLALVILLVGGGAWWGRIRLQASDDSPPIVPLKPLAANAPRKTYADELKLNAVVVADHLTPTTAGPALGICDPIASNAGSDTAAFGAGCTRWLQYAIDLIGNKILSSRFDLKSAQSASGV